MVTAEFPFNETTIVNQSYEIVVQKLPKKTREIILHQ